MAVLIRNKYNLYTKFHLSFTMTNLLESKGRFGVLHTSVTSTGTLYIGPFNIDNSPFGIIVIFFKRRRLVTSTFSSLHIFQNSCGR